MLSFILILGLSAVQSYLLTVLARVAAVKWGVFDHPDGQRKFHVEPTPRLGGVAVYLGFLFAIVELHWSGLTGGATSETLRRMLPLLMSAGLFCGVGLWDDIAGLRPRTKLALQFLAAFPFVVGTRSMAAVSILGISFDLGWMGLPVTLLWLVGCSNIINLIDGLDGLAASLTLIISLTVASLATFSGMPALTLAALAVTGSTGGFLIHNWPPARIFMGDSGSLTLGFLLGALSMEASLSSTASLPLGIPLVLMSVPLFDTVIAITRRLLNGRSIGGADRKHIHHCLRDRGLSTLQCLLVLGGLCLGMALAVIIATILQRESIAVVACLSLLSSMVAGKVFGHYELMQLATSIQRAATGKMTRHARLREATAAVPEVKPV